MTPLLLLSLLAKSSRMVGSNLNVIEGRRQHARRNIGPRRPRGSAPEAGSGRENNCDRHKDGQPRSNQGALHLRGQPYLISGEGL